MSNTIQLPVAKIVAGVILTTTFLFSACKKELQVRKAGNYTLQGIDFNFRGEHFHRNVYIIDSIYSYYHSLPKHKNYELFAEEHLGYEYLQSIAEQLLEPVKDRGYNNYEVAEYFAAITQQSIPYVSDPDVETDWARFPIETLMEDAKDCEDGSLLLCALLETVGIESVLLLYEGHMAVGVACENCEGKTYIYNGKRFVFVETTAERELGAISEKYAYENPKILPVRRTAHFEHSITQKLNPLIEIVKVVDTVYISRDAPHEDYYGEESVEEKLNKIRESNTMHKSSKSKRQRYGKHK